MTQSRARPIYAFRKTGGIDLVFVPIAIKTQRTKHALLVLTRPEDVCLSAWMSWITHDARNTTVSLYRPSMKHVVSPSSERYPDQLHGLGGMLTPGIAHTEEILARVWDYLLPLS